MVKRKKVFNFPYSGNINVNEFNDIYINEISDEIYRHDLEPYPDYEIKETKVNNEKDKRK